MDKKVETVLGDQVSQPVLNARDSWNVEHLMYKPGESWEHGGLISPLDLTSDKDRKGLKVKVASLQPFLGHWQAETPISSTSYCLGILSQ